MNVAICDDESASRDMLRKILRRILSERGYQAQIVSYDSGEAILADIEEGYESFDLMFMDIWMQGMNGIQTARKIREEGNQSRIVFLSQTRDGAVESYEVQASGYLLKPLDEEKLGKLLDHCLLEADQKRIEIRVIGGGNRYLYPGEIMWIESRKNNLEIYLKDRTTVECRCKLDDLELRLDNGNFLRCHQSYLVNMNYIGRMDGCFYMEDGSRIPIRVRSKKQITEEFRRWLLESA